MPLYIHNQSNEDRARQDLHRFKNVMLICSLSCNINFDKNLISFFAKGYNAKLHLLFTPIRSDWPNKRRFPVMTHVRKKDEVQSQWDWVVELASNCCQTSRCINPASMPSLIAGSRLSWSNHIPINKIQCILFYVSLHSTILTNTFCYLDQ